jgi:pimeloyl-ACP methyl ester carboxylesterase
LRFDVSGKGDSEAEKEGQLERERTLADIRGAMDFLSEKRDIANFVLVGSCSGADEAFPLAVADKRVSALVLLDGFGYRTMGYYLTYYRPRIFRPGIWWDFLRLRFEAVLKKIKNGGEDDFARGRIFLRDFPPKKRVESELSKLVEREVRLLFIYSGGVEHYYNYPNQFKDMFRAIDFKSRLTVEYIKEAGHTYPGIGPRRKLIKIIYEWMLHNYGAKKENKEPPPWEILLADSRRLKPVKRRVSIRPDRLSIRTDKVKALFF